MQRPGGRSARAQDAVQKALFELLNERPWEELSVPLVAERSGVHAATVYRRWGTMSGLLNDLVISRLTDVGKLPDTGSLHDDLYRYAGQVAAHLEEAVVPLVLRAAILEIHPHEPRRPAAAFVEREHQLQAMLDRGAERGETTPTLSELLEMVVAPLYFHAIFTTPLPPSEAGRLVDRLVAVVADRESDATTADATSGSA